jgi:hypothetical protein
MDGTQWHMAARKIALIVGSSDAIISKDLKVIIRSWISGMKKLYEY